MEDSTLNKIVLWILWFALIGYMSELVDGQHFWWRVIILTPFTVVTFKISKIIDEYHKNKDDGNSI